MAWAIGGIIAVLLFSMGCFFANKITDNVDNFCSKSDELKRIRNEWFGIK